MCVIHPASVTSVLVERALHRARRAVAASPLRAAVASPRGLLRRCFLTAVDHVPDLIVDSSLRAPRMVFVKLYEFFAVSFERRRRVNRIIRPCAGKSGFPSSLRLAQPRRQRRHLVPDYFVYSSNSRRWHLLPRLLLRLRLPWRPSLLVPLGDGIWLCILPCTFGIGNTGACPSSPMRSRAWQTRVCVARWPDCIDFGIAPSTTASTRRHLRLRRLLHYATTMAPPRAPAASCAATSSSATSTALRRPRLLYVRHH